MIEFLYPWSFILLPLPFAMPYLLPSVTDKNQDALKTPFFSLIAGMPFKGKALLSQTPFLRRFMSLFIWFCVVVAVARPQWVGESVRVKTQGRDIVLALDMSGSMLEKDFVFQSRYISRWEAVKKVASDFISKRTGDRIGIILFGTNAYQFLPLTPDLNTASELLKETEVGMAGPQTAIGDALGLALKSLNITKSSSQVIILLSDGIANAGSIHPQNAAQEAKKAGIKVYTIGAGSEEEEDINSLFNSASSNGIDEATLKNIAQITDAFYFRATDFSSLEKIYRYIDSLEPVTRENLFVRPVKELFYWPLGLAFVFSLLSCIFFYRRSFQ